MAEELRITREEVGGQAVDLHHGMRADSDIPCGWEDRLDIAFQCPACQRWCCACYGNSESELCDDCWVARRDALDAGWCPEREDERGRGGGRVKDRPYYCTVCGDQLDWRATEDRLCTGCEMYERGEDAGASHERRAIAELLDRHGLGVAADLVRARDQEEAA